MLKVLISDKLSQNTVDVFAAHGVDADVKTGLSSEELQAIIGAYDGLAIRSPTKVTEAVPAAADNFKVVGRAVNGVDNVDIAAATKCGGYEYAALQCGYNHRTCDCHNAGTGPLNSASVTFDESRKMGKVPPYGD